MVQKRINTGLVFLNPEQVESHVKNLEVREGIHIVEFPRLATEEEQKENGIFGRYNTENGFVPYVYKWRFASLKEKNEISRKNNGCFQLI